MNICASDSALGWSVTQHQTWLLDLEFNPIASVVIGAIIFLTNFDGSIKNRRHDMTKKLMFLLSCFFGLLIAVSCNSSGEAVVPTPVPSSTPQAVVENNIVPAPMSPNQMIIYEDIQVVMKEAEITSTFITEYGTTREPPPGKNIIWVHILLKNIGQSEQTLPEPEHFSILNNTTEFKATYGHRKDHTDYMALTSILAQGQEVDAWLRFDIPVAMDLTQFIFAFLPESSQVSIVSSSDGSSWTDHPTYLWTCVP